MYRYFIRLSYKGTNFHGWQIQPNAPTVQQELNRGLSLLLRQEISVTGSGRTDTGVHAENYVAHFDSEQELFEMKDWVYKANKVLHKDIAITEIYPVDTSQHSRFSAKCREYKYRIHTRKNPFISEVSAFYTYQFDIEAMNKAAACLLEYDDFTSFSKLHTDVKTNICKVTHACWKKQANGEIIFTVRADRFLRNMVRAIVGTLLDVGRGRLTVEDFERIIKAKDRGKAGVSAPAQGLCLTKVEY